MKVFITGATGFVGRHISKELIEHGHSVIGLARTDEAFQKLQAAGVTPLRGSLTDHAALVSGAQQADAIVHCAYIHNFTDPKFDPNENANVDLQAFKAMVEVIKGTEKKIINTNGSLAAPKGVTLTEDSEKVPIPRDNTTKYVVEMAKQGINTAEVRLAPTVHGKGDWGFIPSIVGAAKRNGYAFYVEDGSARWPAVNVEDAAALYRLALEKKIPAGQRLHAIEDKIYKTKDIAEFIGKKLGVPTKSISIEEAQKQLGFIGWAFGTDDPVTKIKTEELTGWKIQHQGLLEDMEEYYF